MKCVLSLFYVHFTCLIMGNAYLFFFGVRSLVFLSPPLTSAIVWIFGSIKTVKEPQAYRNGPSLVGESRGCPPSSSRYTIVSIYLYKETKEKKIFNKKKQRIDLVYCIIKKKKDMTEG